MQKILSTGSVFILVISVFFGSVTPVFAAIGVGNVTTDTGSGSIILNVPSGAINGDFLLVGIVVDAGSGTSVATPSGWTLISRVNDNDSGFGDNAGDDVSLLTYSRVVGSLEPASYTWIIGGSQESSGGMIRYTGVDSANPIDISSSSNGNGSTATAPSVTTTVNDAKIALFFGADDNISFASPSGAIERYDIPFDSNDDVGSAEFDFTQAIAGATGTKASGMGSSENWVTQTIALRPLEDIIAPVLAQVTAVSTPTNDNTPSYTFSSTEAGTITYGGDCSSVTTAAVAGNNTVTFNTLASGLHNNCTITVTDTAPAHNVSAPLAVNAFTIDPNVFNTGLVSLSFDDGTQSIYDYARPILNAANGGIGYDSTQYIISGAMGCADGGLGCEDFMTTAEVNILESEGHEIAAHTRTDPCEVEPCTGLVGRTPTELLFEVDGLRLDLLQNIGLPVNTFAYPFGTSDDALVAKLKSAGIVGARTVDFIGPSAEHLLNTKTTDRYKLNAVQINVNTPITPLDPAENPDFGSVEEWIDEAIATNKWLVLVFHEIKDACGDEVFCTTPAKLQAITDYLESKGDSVGVVTVREGLSQMNDNPVSNAGVPSIAITEEVVGVVTAEATSLLGAPVIFTPTVTDDDTGLPSTLNAFCTIPTLVLNTEWGVSFPTVATSGSAFSMGTTTVTCTSADTGGNLGTKIFDIVVSNSAVPSVTLTTTAVSPTNVSPIPVTATFSESVTGLVQGDIFVTNGSVSNLTPDSGTTYTFDVTPVVDGEVTVNIPVNSAQDIGGAGNLATTSLSIIYDHTAPELSITDGPADASTITTTETSFSFTATGADTIECKLDAEGYAPCESPKALTALAEGPHTFMVRASDIAGNLIEVSRTFTVDTLPPTLLEVTPVPSPASITPSYTFSSTEAGAITYGGSCSSATADAVVGNNIVVFNALVGGIYSDCTITVTDASLHASAPLAVNEFTVDDSAPVITINSQPNPFINTIDTSIDFTVEGASTVACTLNTATASCVSPVSLTSLSEAPHSFVIVATDEVGNGATSTINFTVDLTPPQLTVNTQITNDTTPTITGTTDDSADVTVTVNAVEYLATPVLGVWSVTIPAENSLADGGYPVSAISTDIAGNPSNFAEGTLTINTQAPNLALDPIAPNATTVTGTTEPGITVTVTVTDSELNGHTYNASVDEVGIWTAAITDTFAEGVYDVMVTAADELGNMATIPSTLTIDITAPVLALVGTDPVDVNLNGVYTEEGATGTDNIDPTVTVVVGGDTVDTSVLGNEYTVTYSATDTSGNSSEITRVVRIKDLEGPVLTLNGDSPMNLAVGQDYIESGATGIDNVDVSVVVTIGGDTVNTAVVGTYSVTYDAVDTAGNIATQITRIVVVSDLAVSSEQTNTPATDSVTITWTTSHLATSRVIYDTVSHEPITESAPNYGYANSTVENATLVTEHSVTVEGLIAGTTYFLRPVSHGSPEILGSELSATTGNPPPVQSSGGGSSGGSSRPPTTTNGSTGAFNTNTGTSTIFAVSSLSTDNLVPESTELVGLTESSQPSPADTEEAVENSGEEGEVNISPVPETLNLAAAQAAGFFERIPKLWWGIIVLLAIAGGYYVWSRGGSKNKRS